MELARTLNAPRLAFRPLGDLLFELYVTLRPHPECPTWQTHRRAGPAVRAALGLLVQWVGFPETRRFSQTRLAHLVGLHRTAITRLLATLETAGALTKENPDRHGRFEHGLRWTPALVDLLRARTGWEERLTLLWHVDRLPDDLRPADPRLRVWFLRPNGSETLASWYSRAQGIERWRRRRDERACREAVARATRCAEVEGGQKITPPTPPRLRKGRLSASPNAARAREDRTAAPLADDPRWGTLDRQDVTDRLAGNVTEVEEARTDFYRAAELVGEHRPAAGWRQVRNLARRCGTTLTDVVGRYVQAADRVRRDEPARVLASAGGPHALPPIRFPGRLTMWFVRVGLGLAPGPTQTAPRWRPRPKPAGACRPPAAPAHDLDDLVAEEAEPMVEVGGRLPLFVPEPEPERRLTPEECRAIRERAAATHSPGAPMPAESPPIDPEPGRAPACPKRSLAAAWSRAVASVSAEVGVDERGEDHGRR